MGVVLVTGATGFAGGHLLRHLAGQHELVGWGRSAPPTTIPGVRWQQIDLLDRDAVRHAIREIRPTAVFHCAGAANVGDSWADTLTPLAANVRATHHLLDALRRAGVDSRIVITGSAVVYAPSTQPLREDDPLAPQSPYAYSKLAQEELGLRAIAEDGLPIVIARAFNHTGPGQSGGFVAPDFARQVALIEQGRSEPVIRVGNLETQRDLSDVRDVVRAYAALMDAGRSGVVYNVASGIGRSIRSILDGLVARARVPVRIETDPARVRTHDAARLVGDASRLRSTTGWEPTVPFEQTMDDLLEYWRSRVAVTGHA